MSRFNRVLTGSRIALLALGLAACAPTGGPPDAGQCIVYAPDFASYESWPTSFTFPAEPDAGTPSLDAGCTSPHNFSVPRTVYMKTIPPDGSTEFPACTMIVKETRVASDPSTWQVYAMVKDGVTAPGDTCPNWEWFELDDSTSSGASPANPSFLWRGALPPSGSYQGCQSCSSCHTNAQNDCVWSVPLSSF
jgi:hypothetical protein